MTIKSISEKIQNKYSDLVTIIMIVQLIAALIQIYKACKKEDEEVDVEKLSTIDKIVFNRVVKRHLPKLSLKQRRLVSNEILAEIQSLSKEEINAIMSDPSIRDYT